MTGIKYILASMLVALTAVVVPAISYAQGATTTPEERERMEELDRRERELEERERRLNEETMKNDTNNNDTDFRDLMLLRGSSGSRGLSDLFVLDRLFSDGGSGNLGEWIILDQLFSDNGSAKTSTDGGGLWDLIILDELSGGHGDFGGGDSSLGGLFFLD